MIYLWISLGVLGVVIILSLLLSISSNAYDRFLEKYKTYNNVLLRNDARVLDFFQYVNKTRLGGKIKLAMVDEKIGDCYAPKIKTLGIIEKTIKTNSLASFTVVSHELGHAIQDCEGKKLKTLNFLRRLGSFISVLFIPLLIASVIMFFLQYFLIAIILASSAGGILLLSIIVKTITISIEKDASKKGLSLLEEFMTKEELKQAKDLLNSAKLTYWSDLLRLLFSWTFLTQKTKLFR